MAQVIELWKNQITEVVYMFNHTSPAENPKMVQNQIKGIENDSCSTNTS